MSTTRQRTRVIVQAHSHVESETAPYSSTRTNAPKGRVIDLSADVIAFNSQKAVKTMGKFQFTLVPNKNYLNYLYPNDIINLYVDTGVGLGFVRTMMGYVDRVERQETTGPNGEMTTSYVVICSDFQKAIDKTHIYFNAFMRQILDERFARTDDGSVSGNFSSGAEGSALRNAGLTLFGTPADFVENFMTVLVGFGQQWRLPPSYAQNKKVIDKTREKRRQRTKARVPQNILQAIDKLGFNRENYENKITEILKAASQASRVDLTEAEKNTEQARERKEAGQTLTQNPSLIVYRTVLETTDPQYPIGILDLMSFDFIESLAIDGFNLNDSVAQMTGTLSQFLYGHCNDIVNELMFDLRPVQEDGLVKGDYSKEPDELGINQGGLGAFKSPINAVKYVPAIVFREYPYSVVQGMDLTDLTIVPAGGDPASKTYPGSVAFGPIFAQEPNKAGRKIYKYDKSLSLTNCEFNQNQEPVKHLDVVVIKNTDVISASLGRSDEDLFNTYQLNPRGSAEMTNQYRSILSNFSPVLNQISIARNGLRLREDTTSFSNYSNGSACLVGGSADSSQVRRNIVRWSLLIDHWYQHNVEYLSGTIQLKGMPEIRAGYRLDWEGRSESYYVEAVGHQWQYGQPLKTTVTVTRGQRNDPFLAYIPPVFLNDGGAKVNSSGDRSSGGRLAKHFKVRDTGATTKATTKSGTAELDGNETDSRGGISRSGTVVFADVGQSLGEFAPEGQRPSLRNFNDLVGIDEDKKII